MADENARQAAAQERAEQNAENAFLKQLDGLNREEWTDLKARVAVGETTSLELPGHRGLSADRAIQLTQDFMSDDRWLDAKKEAFLEDMNGLKPDRLETLRGQLAAGEELKRLPSNRDLTDEEKQTLAAGYLNSDRWEANQRGLIEGALNKASVAELRKVLDACKVTGGAAIDPMACEVASGVAAALGQKASDVQR